MACTLLDYQSNRNFLNIADTNSSLGYSQRTFDKNPFKMMLAYTKNELLIVEWPIFCLLMRVVPSSNFWIIVLGTIPLF